MPENTENTEINAMLRQAYGELLQTREARQEQREHLHARYGVILPEDWMERAIAWLTQKWGTRPCPYCGDPNWNVGAKLLEGRTWGEEGVIPMLQVTCSNCGQTVSVDATVAGLIEGSEQT